MLAIFYFTLLSAFIGLISAVALQIDPNTPFGVGWIAFWVFLPFIVSAVATYFETPYSEREDA